MHQMPTYLVFKKVYSMLAWKFWTVYHLVTVLKNDKAKCKAALRKYIHTHPFFSVYEFFLCVKIIYNIDFFCIMFIVFYNVNLHICIFMTCSTSYCLYDILMDPWNVCTYVCCWGDIIHQCYGLKVVGLLLITLYVLWLKTVNVCTFLVGVHCILDGITLMLVHMQRISQVQTVSCNIFYVLTKL